MSIRCRDQHRPVIMEALRRARYKFPGRQKIIVSKKWGFTSLDRADYEALRSEHKVMPDGAYVQVRTGRQAVPFSTRSNTNHPVPQGKGSSSPQPPNCRDSGCLSFPLLGDDGYWNGWNGFRKLVRLAGCCMHRQERRCIGVHTVSRIRLRFAAFRSTRLTVCSHSVCLSSLYFL